MALVITDPMAQVHIDEICDQIREWLAQEVARDARRFAPEDTGYLMTHIRVQDGGRRVVALGAGLPPNADAPAYVEFGTRPHSIDSHGDYPLRSKTGQAFGRHVNHPGTAPQPFMRPAAYRKRRIPPWVVQARANLAPR